MIAINLTLIIQLAIVLGLMLILTQIVFKPFLRVLQQRKDRLLSAEEKVLALQKKTEELIQQYQEAISAAKAQGEKMREDMRKNSQAREAVILETAQKEAEHLVQELKKKIAEETAATRVLLQQEIRNFSREIAERILGRSIA